VLSLDELAALEYKQVAQERETTDPDPELWRWSPLELPVFAHMLVVACSLASDGLRRLRFAEAGCGIGTKLYLAKYYHNLDETGYEINDEYLERCRELGVRAEKCDLRTETPPWEKFDIVYMARPFKSDESDTVNPDAAEIEWERGVMRRMRRGGVLVSAYAAVKPYGWPCYYRAAYRGVWVKPKSEPVYDARISRETAGSDPLVPEPLGKAR
jgi:SAM-dependent methyltransferase